MLRLTPKELNVTLNYVDSLEHEITTQDPGYSWMALSYFMQVVCYLLRTRGNCKNTDRRALLCVSKAIDHLQTHGDEPIKVDQLATLCYMSKRNFARAFQLATGSSPIAYLIELRLARAAAMLRGFDKNVTSIAYDVGFNDSNYFARRFQKMYGVTPSDYRKQQGPG